MRTRAFGSLSRQVPLVGQGTWKLPEHGQALDEAIEALKLGIEMGMVHIDTAEMYGDGGSEEAVGQAIKGLPRDRLFIVSKVLPSNASLKGTIAACEKSLKRLKTDYLDCYLLHWRGSHPVRETMQAMEQLVKEGKIRSLGVSNFDIEDIEEAQQHLEKERIVCDQVLYHMADRGIEKALIPYCQQRSIAVVAYTPFGQKQPPENDCRDGQVLDKVAKKHQATVRQVMLAFLVRGEHMFTIPKASKASHVKENSDAGDLILDADDVTALDEAFPAPRSRVPLSWA